jgi:aryl sulfotransferase
MPERFEWPEKTRELHNHHFDSTIWNDLSFRDDDIVDSTHANRSFEWMKKNATQTVPLGGAFWDAGAEVFIHKGVNGRWMDTLSAKESAEYEKRGEAELGAECARWLATGEVGS